VQTAHAHMIGEHKKAGVFWSFLGKITSLTSFRA